MRLYYRWVDENGDLVQDEEGNYILLTVHSMDHAALWALFGVI